MNRLHRSIACSYSLLASWKSCLLAWVTRARSRDCTLFWSRDIGIVKRSLGYSVRLLGSCLVPAIIDSLKAAEWYKQTPCLHSDLKISLFGFGLLWFLTVVARSWLWSWNFTIYWLRVKLSLLWSLYDILMRRYDVTKFSLILSLLHFSPFFLPDERISYSRSQHTAR